MLLVYILVFSSSICPSKIVGFAKKIEQKSYFTHQSPFRRFAFPPGTFLIFEPELTLPVWRDRPISRKGRDNADDNLYSCDGSFSPREGFEEEVSAVKNSDIIISSPFYVYFDKLGWTHKDSIYNSHNHFGPYIQNYLVSPALSLFGVPPSSPPTSSNNKISEDGSIIPFKKISQKRISLSDSHRLAVFHKIEKVLEEIGVQNGKACLLRTICELHEFPFDSGRFGLLGELLTLVLGSIPKPSDDEERHEGGSCLGIYAKAESSGKQKDCFKYSRHCQHSIFQWYWKFSNPALIQK